MNFQFYVEKLKSLPDFKKFVKENKKSFPCSCFFIIDREEHGKDKQHFDFFIPGKNSVVSFKLENGSEKIQPEETKNIQAQSFSPVSLEYDFDFDEVEEKIREKMLENRVNQKIQKMIFSMQNKNGKDFLVGTVFISSFGLINVTINLHDWEITSFDKKSFFDMMNIFKKKE